MKGTEISGYSLFNTFLKAVSHSPRNSAKGFTETIDIHLLAGPRGFEPRISGFPLLSGGLRAILWRPLDALIQAGLRANRKEADPGFSLSLADPLDDGGLRDFKDFYEALTDIRMKVLFCFMQRLVYVRVKP